MSSDGRRHRDQLTVGLNSTLRLIRSGEAAEVHLACDCADHIRQTVRSEAAGNGVPVDERRTMAQLGAACGIDVGCAVYAVRKTKILR